MLSCVSKKLDRAAPAGELYVSSLFKLALGYASLLAPTDIFILSAKYGLVGIDDIIEPYDVTLNSMGAAERRAWAKNVLEALRGRTSLAEDQFTFLAGDRYRADLVPHLRHVAIPMAGLRIGEQLQFLSQRLAATRA